MIYITGDTHGDLSRISEFCINKKLSQDDIIIILGDVGLNYFADMRDQIQKKTIADLPMELFCIHGNHEIRPENISSYFEKEWNGGKVYIEDAYPNILFAKDGEIYNLNSMTAIAIGGAYSLDKYYRLNMGYPWFEDEQPSYEIKLRVENSLKKSNWNVDIVLSHTCSLRYEPNEVFINGIEQSTIDKSTEIWLDSLESKLNYRYWFCGHYHTNKIIEKMHFLYELIVKF